MAWRCRFLTARRSQHGSVIAERNDFVKNYQCTRLLISTQVPAKCVAWLPASESDFFDDAGRPAALYKIRYTGGELVGDHEDLEAHEIEQSKPMSARELAAAEKDDDDSVKSKASKFDPNEEVDSPDEDSDDDWGGRPATGPPSASKKRTRNNDVPSDDGEDDDGAVAPPSEKKQLRSALSLSPFSRSR